VDNSILVFGILIIFIVLLCIGMRIGTLLLGIGIVAIYLLFGKDTIAGLLQNDPFTVVAAYALTPIPLFVFMAHCIMQSRILDKIYYVAFKVSKGSAGLLGSLTVFVGGFLGAVSGSGVAISAALAQIVSPQLVKRGFSRELSAATCATGGSLASIIPPSIILIIYGSLTETSVGKLFIGALIPGLLLMGVYAICVAVTYQLLEKPRKSIYRASQEDALKYDEIAITADEETFSGKEIFTSFFMGFLLILIVLGGIYSGAFTPTEAAAVATLVALIYCVYLKTANLQFLKEALKDTAHVSGMILFILVAAQIFGRLVSLLKIPALVVSSLTPILDKPFLVIALLMVFYFLIGMFMEAIAGMIMSVPVTLPIMEAVGMDPLWFGIVVGLLLCIGLVTPPIGMAVFSASTTSGVSLSKLFPYTIVWSIIGFIIVGGCLMLFPEVATYLPSKM
jgi:C4-dicarboxylate transporter DctM subunit